MNDCKLEGFGKTPNEYIVPSHAGLACKVKVINEFFEKYAYCNFLSEGAGNVQSVLHITATHKQQGEKVEGMDSIVLWIMPDPTKKEIAKLFSVVTKNFNDIQDAERKSNQG
ncbi:hypothetical protein [Hymenobacter persicinus]|uniref:Uncharacterized protein n=1 Tax=Hymenobacter persicinus TaxID=2025506 RepID=A0A4Q5LD24_9BACT|nr:hypothetical protein [Hymenobacter persicinus]RYU81258.1 hypothetical protein EWM57_06690 [Hymenobacter persicinus]